MKRRLIFALIAVIVAAISLLLLQYCMPAITGWLLNNPGRIQLYIMLLAVIIMLPLLGFSVYLWNVGRKIVQFECFPPPKANLTKKSPALRGSSARKRGRMIQLTAILLAFSSIILLMVFWKLSVLLSKN